jgi:hypothetical protein
VSRSGEFTTGESRTGGGEFDQQTAPNTTTGQFKSGGGLTGDAVRLELADPGATVQVDAQPGDLSAAGATAVSDPGATVDVATPTASLAYRIGDPGATVGFDTPTGDITGAGDATVADAGATVELDTPIAQVGYRRWAVAGQPLTVQSATLTPTTLTLDVRARSSSARSTLETLDDNAGAYEQRQLADGTVDGVDTSKAGAGNVYTVTPPVYLQPERVERDWLADSVERDRASADTQATLSTVEFAATTTRDAIATLSDATAANSWAFNFSAGGRIVTDRVSSIQQGETTTVALILEPEQAELFETVAATTAGAVVRVVPDGETFSEDTTPNGRQTVTVDPPDDAADPALPAGTYVITDWTSRGTDGGAYRVEMGLSTRYEAQ